VSRITNHPDLILLLGLWRTQPSHVSWMMKGDRACVRVRTLVSLLWCENVNYSIVALWRDVRPVWVRRTHH